MDDSFDREKVVDCMFDPTTSMILAELEDGKKECSFLAQQSSLSESDVLQRLSYLIQHGFVFKTTDGDGDATADTGCFLTANFDKLESVVADSGNFDATISGLEKMDSYLN